MRKKIKIHAWGGLGSQLFAIAVAYDLSAKYHYWSMKIVLHTGGVTMRTPEITSLFPEYEYEYINDFVPAGTAEVKVSNRLRFEFSWIVKSLLVRLRLVGLADNDSSFERIMPWTKSLRGHYSYRTISAKFISEFSNRIGIVPESNPHSEQRSISVHYRLGDLLLLSEKKPIEPIRIVAELNRKNNQTPFDTFYVYSDSPEVAIAYLSEFSDAQFVKRDLGTIDTFIAASMDQDFVGTSSKISFWIAAVRGNVLSKSSSLPAENLFESSGLIHGCIKLISYY